MPSQNIRQIAITAGGFVFGAIAVAAVIVAIRYATPVPQPQPAPATQYGPETGPPADARTLDYEAMVGLDPQTQQTNRERERHNDHEWRLKKLESEMRAVLQRVYGTGAVRIGESGPTDETAPDTSEGSQE